MGNDRQLRLVAIGYLGRYDVYVGLTRDEAVYRHDREHPDNTVADGNLTVREYSVTDGHFMAYDVWTD